MKQRKIPLEEKYDEIKKIEDDSYVVMDSWKFSQNKTKLMEEESNLAERRGVYDFFTQKICMYKRSAKRCMI